MGGVDNRDAALAELRVLGVGADEGGKVPASSALVARGAGDADRDGTGAGNVCDGFEFAPVDGLSGGGGDLDVGDDEEVPQIVGDFWRVETSGEIGVFAVDIHLGLERRADELGVAGVFEHLVDGVSNLQEGVPELDVIAGEAGPGFRSRRPAGDEDGNGSVWLVVRQRLESLLSHVRGERRDGGNQAFDSCGYNRLASATFDVVLFTNVQFILAHVQVHV